NPRRRMAAEQSLQRHGYKADDPRFQATMKELREALPSTRLKTGRKDPEREWHHRWNAALTKAGVGGPDTGPGKGSRRRGGSKRSGGKGDAPNPMRGTGFVEQQNAEAIQRQQQYQADKEKRYQDEKAEEEYLKKLERRRRVAAGEE